MLSLLAFSPAVYAADWCYPLWDQPSCTSSQYDWVGYDANCGGNKQSPIDIDTDDTEEPDDEDAEFTFVNWELSGFGAEMYNKDGHGFNIKLDQATSGIDFAISGGGFAYNGTYLLDGVHMHWGENGAQGSEHRIDGKQYPAEVHFVHYKDTFADVATALASGESDALAVLGFFVEPEEDTNTAWTVFTNPLSAVGLTLDIDSQAALAVNVTSTLFDLAIPASEANRRFYRYEGSLTTPTCNEQVIWTVFKNTIKMSGQQLLDLEKIERFLPSQPTNQSAGIVPLLNNWRDVQDIGDRDVYCYGDCDGGWLAGGLGLAAAILVLSIVFICCAQAGLFGFDTGLQDEIAGKDNPLLVN